MFTVSTSSSGTVVLSLLSINGSLRIANPATSGKTAYNSRLLCGIGGSLLLSYQLTPGTMVLDYAGGILLPSGQVLCVNTLASSSSLGLTITSTAAITWWET